MAFGPRDLLIPGAAILIIVILVAAFIIIRLRRTVNEVTKKANKNTPDLNTPEGRDKKKLRDIELQRQAFVLDRYVEAGIQDHSFFRRKKLADEEDRFKGSNNMFYVDPDASKQQQIKGGGAKGQETSLALVFGCCELGGSSVCEDEAEKAKGVLEKLGYRVCCFSHNGRNAPPSSAAIAKLLKHLALSRRRWQSVVVYICGACRTVEIPSVAASGIELESEIGKRIAAKEQVVPTMWELLVDSGNKGDNKSWIDLTTLLFRVRQAASTVQPVAVFLDIAVAPSAPKVDSSSKKDGDDDDQAQKAALVRASFTAATSNGRDEVQAILPPQLLQQIEIVYSRRECPPPGAPTKRSYFNQAFVRGCGGSDGSSGGGSKQDQLSAMLAQSGIGGAALAAARMLGSPSCGLDADARLCGAITAETIAAFAEKTLQFFMKKDRATTGEDGEEEDSEEDLLGGSKNKIIHISPLPGSCELHLQPVHGPRCGFRPDLLLGQAHRQTADRTDKLWAILSEHFNKRQQSSAASSSASPPPVAVVRGFATTTTLKYLTWNSEVLSSFPDSVVYVDLSNYALRHAAPHDGSAALDVMWRSALQVVSNSYISYNRTWNRICECANTVEAALVAAASEGSRRFLLVFDNVPDFQAAVAASSSSADARDAAVADSGSLVHPSVFGLVERLRAQDIELCVVVGTAGTSFMPMLSTSPITSSRPQQDGYVQWMMNVPPVSALQPNKKKTKQEAGSAALAVELGENSADVAARTLSASSSTATTDKKKQSTTPTAWQLAAVSAGRHQQFSGGATAAASSTASIDKILHDAVSVTPTNLDLAHRNLLELVNYMQRDMQNCAVPVEVVSHYAELHCGNSIDAACRATGLSLLAQKGLVRRTALIQPRGLETECVFVNPAVRKFLSGSSSSSSSSNNTDSYHLPDSEPATRNYTSSSIAANDKGVVIPIKLPRSALESHLWRAATVFAQIPQLKDPNDMALTSGAALFHDTARSYFPRFLLSIAYISAASHDTLRAFPVAGEMGITPERCDVVLQAFLNAPQVYGDLVATMGVAATSTMVESTAAITAGQGGSGSTSKQLRQAAAAKIVTTMRTVSEFLDNNPHEWAFQLCHRGVRGFYNNQLTFARVPARGMKCPGDMSGLAVPIVTCSSSINKSSNVNKYSTILLDAPSRPSIKKEDEKKQQQQQQRYPTVMEYAPLNAYPAELRGLLVVGYSDGSISIFRPTTAGDATASEVAPWPDALFEAGNEKAHGVGNAVTNILFEIDEKDAAEERKRNQKKKPKQEASDDDEDEEEDEEKEKKKTTTEEQKKKEEEGEEEKKPRQNTRIITASRSNGSIYRWSFHLEQREDLGKIDPRTNQCITRCVAPFYARILRFCTDEERLAHERLGFLGPNPAAEEDADKDDDDANNQDDDDGGDAAPKPKKRPSAMDVSYRRTTHTTFESGGEIVVLMCGPEHDGEMNQVLLTLAEVRQCVVSMTFDTEPIKRPAEWKNDGLITSATVGVDSEVGCVIVCVGDRAGRLMQFELRFYYEKSAAEELEEMQKKKQQEGKKQVTFKKTGAAAAAAAAAPVKKSVEDLE